MFLISYLTSSDYLHWYKWRRKAVTYDAPPKLITFSHIHTFRVTNLIQNVDLSISGTGQGGGGNMIFKIIENTMNLSMTQVCLYS